MKKIIVRGPVLSRSGYGEHARFLLRTLRDNEDKVDIYLINTPWGATSWLHENNEEREWIDSLLLKTITAGNSLKADASIQVTVPNEWVRICDKNIGLTAGIETDRISDSWIRGTHLVDKIIVPSSHAKSGFESAHTNLKDPFGSEREIRVDAPIDVVSFPHKNCEPKEISRLNDTLSTDFNFLTVAQISPRKNIESGLIAFLEEFHNEENVGFIMKLNIKNNSLVDRQNTKTAIKSLLENFPDRKCKIHLIHGNLSDEEMAGLYNHEKVSAYVSTSHGEGFGLPVFEAASHSVPVIAPNWSGYTDYTSFKPTTKSKNAKSYLVGVDYKIAPVQDEAVWNGVIERGTNWCFVDLQDLKVKMREVYSEPAKYQKSAEKLQKHIVKNFTETKQRELLFQSIMEVL